MGVTARVGGGRNRVLGLSAVRGGARDTAAARRQRQKVPPRPGGLSRRRRSTRSCADGGGGLGPRGGREPDALRGGDGGDGDQAADRAGHCNQSQRFQQGGGILRRRQHRRQFLPRWHRIPCQLQRLSSVVPRRVHRALDGKSDVACGDGQPRLPRGRERAGEPPAGAAGGGGEWIALGRLDWRLPRVFWRRRQNRAGEHRRWV
mmetsp:Transcript_36439/g.90878  ORF Transcript_36439/g.90878 Transcript_36439/m.90878 type:complete len:204 (+) Transcript_36439:586-1197(+)